MKTILDKLRYASVVAAAAIFVLIFLVIVAEIFCRTFLGFSTLWYMDFVQLSVCWMLAFGMSAIVYSNDHLQIDFIKAKFSPAGQFILGIITEVLELAFFVMLVPYGIKTAITKMKISFTTLHLPTGYMYAALPVFGALCAIFMAYRLWVDVSSISKKGGKNAG